MAGTNRRQHPRLTGYQGMPLTLRHVPPSLDEEPAYRDDPILGWRHVPEPPADLRVGGSPWPPRSGRGGTPETGPAGISPRAGT